MGSPDVQKTDVSFWGFFADFCHSLLYALLCGLVFRTFQLRDDPPPREASLHAPDSFPKRSSSLSRA